MWQKYSKSCGNREVARAALTTAWGWPQRLRLSLGARVERTPIPVLSPLGLCLAVLLCADGSHRANSGLRVFHHSHESRHVGAVCREKMWNDRVKWVRGTKRKKHTNRRTLSIRNFLQTTHLETRSILVPDTRLRPPDALEFFHKPLPDPLKPICF